MGKRRGISFLNFLLNFIIAAIMAGLVIFVYFCFNYGVETTVTEIADNFNLSKIIPSENESTIEIPVVENPLSAAEIVNNSQDLVKRDEAGYYYAQIDENAKIIYDALMSNEVNLRKGNYKIEFGNQFNELLNQENGTESLNSSYQQALDALTLDHPEVFYLDISKMLLMIYSRKTILKTTYTVSIESEENGNYFSDEFKTEEEVNQAVNRVEYIRDDLYNQLEGDTYNKIKDIHDCLVNELEYEQTISKPNIRNIYGALVTKEVVCEGYAKAFKYILDGLDIPNIIVVGTATNSSGVTESHAWSYVLIDDAWYAIDVTWDDPIIVGNGKLPEMEKYRYFLRGSETFNKNHTITGQVSDNGMKFLYPELSELDYVY